jgi:hypothetical protein
MDYSEAFFRALHILATIFLVFWGYSFCKIIVTRSIKEHPKTHTFIGKTITYLLCATGSILAAFIFAFLFKSNTRGLTAFFVLLPCSLIAAYRSYLENEE